MARPAEPAFSESRVYDTDAVDRLAQMGLRPGYFEAAIRRGHERASSCLPVHPKTYPGQVMWAETVGELFARRRQPRQPVG